MAEANPAQLKEFGEAIGVQLMGRSLTWLGDEAGVSKQTAADWRNGEKEPKRATVFALEELFELAPGSLSRLLGYLPANAAPVRTPEEAIRSDVTLSAGERKSALAFIEGLRG